jgi:hypothetical protein
VAGFLNGVAGTSHTAIEVDNTSPILLGGAPGGGSYTGDIDEIVLFNSNLSSTDLTSMSTYINGRYGFAG